MVPALDEKGDPFSCSVGWGGWVQRFFHSFACQASGCEGRQNLCPWPQRGAWNSKEAPGLQRLAVPQQPFPCTHHRSRHELRALTSCKRMPPLVDMCLWAFPWREDFSHISSGVSDPQSWEPMLFRLASSHFAWFSDYLVSTTPLPATRLHLPSTAVTRWRHCALMDSVYLYLFWLFPETSLSHFGELEGYRQWT